jgi:hypothetical protein
MVPRATRLSIATATGGILVDSAASNNVALTLTSRGPGWGSGLQLLNTSATTGRNYGLYAGGDGSLRVVDATAGADRLRIDPDGRVGIGKAPSAAYKVDVAGTINAADVHKNGSSVVSSQWVDAGGSISYGGNVGVGLSNPQRALSVNAALNVDQANANNGAVNPGITFGSASGEGIASKRTAGGNQFGLDLYTGSTVRLSITNGGNVAIGSNLNVAGQLRWGNSVANPDSIELGAPNSATPGGGGTPFIDFHFRDRTEDFNTRIINDENGRLSIVGNLNVTGHIASRVFTTAPGTLHVQPQDGTTEGGEITLLGAGSNGHATIDNYAGSFRVITQGAERLRVSSNGNVGIGAGRLRVSESDGPQTSGVLELANAAKTNYVFTDGPSGHLHARTDSQANHVLLQAGGTQGNVGIGMANPQAKLHISSGEPQFRLESTGDRALMQLAKGGAPQWDFGVGQRAGNNDFWFGDMLAYRMVLQKGTGNVGIGTPNPRQRLDVDGNIRWGNNWLSLDQGGSIELGGDNSTPGVGVPYIDFHFRGLTQDFNTRIINDENGRLSIQANLNVTGSATKPGGGFWTAASDVRLKKSVRSLKGALEKLLRLRGVSFEWKDPQQQGNLTGEQMGLVAQEVEEVFPEWIDTDSSGYKIITVRGFEALAVEAFKQLRAENDELRARIEALEPA